MENKITRRAFCSTLLALPFAASAQQAKRVPFIGLTIPQWTLMKLTKVIQ
jgi:hypothetical protein